MNEIPRNCYLGDRQYGTCYIYNLTIVVSSLRIEVHSFLKWYNCLFFSIIATFQTLILYKKGLITLLHPAGLHWMTVVIGKMPIHVEESTLLDNSIYCSSASFTLNDCG